MKKFFYRLTHSARGERFNPLIYPFLISTAAYGIGFSFFTYTDTVSKSSLFMALGDVWNPLPFVWGVSALLTILVGVWFLVFNKPPAGKTSGIAGFMLWTCATLVYMFSGGWLTLFSVAIPNMYFWFWQYLSLSAFKREDREDIKTLRAYNSGEYDNEEDPEQGKADRERNRGMDRQTHGKYDNEDNGGDTTRPL